MKIAPMDLESRMERARQLGFTIPAYHGTNTQFNEFSLDHGLAKRMAGHAPHFSSSKEEAIGYAKLKGGKSHVLHVLLRVKKPFIRDWNTPISNETYKKIVGKESTHNTDLFGAAAIDDLYNNLQKKLYPNGAINNKVIWTKIYKKLISLGYDAIVTYRRPADYSEGFYDQYVVLDPKNVRSIDAAFNIENSESRHLREMAIPSENFKDDNSVHQFILSMTKIAKKRYRNSLYGGNCGTFALAMANILHDHNVQNIKIGFIVRDIDNEINDLQEAHDKETDFYHVVLEYNDKFYDGSGEVSKLQLLEFSIQEYGDDEPAFFSDCNFDDPIVNTCIEFDTNWSISISAFYNYLKTKLI